MTVDSSTGALFEDDAVPEPMVHKAPEIKHKVKIFWRNVFTLTYFHIASIYGVYLALTNTKWQTFAWVALLYVITKIGITAGVHRYWTHRSYKAKLPLRVILMFFFTLAFEGKVYVWARDHRVHHKYQETDADPYNAGRGFWFAHMTWLLQSKHPEVLKKGQGIDVSDLKNDKLVMFQKKYYWPIVYVICLFMPTFVPWYYWNESLITAWHVAVCLRYILSYHGTWVVNSFAHMYGNRPYEVSIYARENGAVSFISLGEGWHNYHHTFPWDYKTSELGNYGLNLTTAFIDFMAKIGWAYDLKTVPPHLVKKRALRTGDGTYKDVWGWDDKDLPLQEKKEATIVNKKD
ncbi:acyl-CoA Delta-9 desaturase-like [Lycorma delicatula]|uniref:acyl-CoA Delta-9 desaturase-like n=1 Tax=Lycorma delicatula TaxID=130591 RepID=UPI003F513CF1